MDLVHVKTCFKKIMEHSHGTAKFVTIDPTTTDLGPRLEIEENVEKNIENIKGPYRQLLEGLMRMANKTRKDIMYPAKEVAEQSRNPDP